MNHWRRFMRRRCDAERNGNWLRAACSSGDVYLRRRRLSDGTAHRPISSAAAAASASPRRCGYAAARQVKDHTNKMTRSDDTTQTQTPVRNRRNGCIARPLTAQLKLIAASLKRTLADTRHRFLSTTATSPLFSCSRRFTRCQTSQNSPLNCIKLH